MKKLLLSTLIFLGCGFWHSHEKEYVLHCYIDGYGHSWYAKERIYFDPKAQAYYVDGNYIPPGGALCNVYYND